MKKILLVFIFLLLFPFSAFAVTPPLTVPQGGTGWGNFVAGTIPFGGSSLRLSTSSDFTFTTAGSLFFAKNASTTALSATVFCLTGDTCRTTWPSGGSSASSTLLIDNNTFSGINNFTNASSNFGGTWQTFAPSHFQTALGFTAVPNTRSVFTTYPLQGGGALSADLTLTTAFSTTTANAFSQLQQFNANASTSALTVSGSTWLGSATCSGANALQTTLGLVTCGGTFSTTSASYFLSQNQGAAFSTTSAAYWQTQSSFFSTTSASYFLSVNQGPAFSTTSAAYFLTQNTGNAFSTTSANYWGGTKGYLTSLAGAASSTLLADNNVFTGGNIFTASTTIGSGIQTGGVTINGGATTTGNAYVGGGFLTLAGPSSGTALIQANVPFRNMALILGVNFSDSVGLSSGNYTGSNSSVGLSQNNAVVAGGGSGAGYVWTSGSLAQSYDTGLSRLSAGVVAVGTGAKGSTAGGLIAASSTILGNFTSTGNGVFGGILNVSGATSTFANGINLTTGCFAVAGTCIGGSGSGTVTGVTAVYPLASTGGTSPIISSATSSATSAGVLSAADWTTFNSKQAAGSYITALTGDATASGPGSVAATLATVNSNVGSFTNANITVNAKGLITAASNGTAGSASSTLLSDNNTFSGADTFSSTITGSISGNAGTVTNGVYTTGAGTVYLTPTGSAASLTSFPTFNQNTTGSAAKLTTARTINGVSFDGTASIVVASTTLLSDTNTWTKSQSFANATSTLFSATTAWIGTLNLTNPLAVAQGGTGLTSTSQNFALMGPTSGSGAPTWRAIVAADIPTLNQNTTGSAATLTTPRNINNVSFNGSADITITAASSTLLANNNTFSGNDVFSASTTVNAQLNLQGATTTLLTTGAFWDSSITSALALFDANHKETAYTGSSCTNQFPRSVNASGAWTCATVANTDLANSTISGIALGSNLNSLSTNSSLTGTSYNGSAAVSNWGLNLSNSNAWTVLQTFSAASSTILSVFSTANFGGTATSTFTNAGFLGIASSSPFMALSVGPNSAITTTEASSTWASTINVNWKNGNQQKFEMNGATTVQMGFNTIPGQTLRLVLCQDGTGSRAVTWGSASTSIIWSGGTAPTQTATAFACDVYSFLVTGATSTASAVTFGTASQNFQ